METLNTLSMENKDFYDKTLLKRLLPTLVYANYGQKRSLPANSGKLITFRKYNSLPPIYSPLQEGVTPEGSSLSVSEFQSIVEQYGDYVEISDMVDLVGIDPVLTETAELLGEQAGETIDRVIREKISNGTNVRYVGSGDNIAYSTNTVSGVMTAKEIQKAVRTLKNDNAKPFDGKYYIGIIDPDISYDLQQDPLFLDVSKYNGGTQIIDGEIGKLGKVRFIETTNTRVEQNLNGKYVHSALIIGKDAYGIVDIEGSSKPEMIVKPHGSSGTSDPLNQRATSGWKALFTAERLNELAMIRIECLTSTEEEYIPSNESQNYGESPEPNDTIVDGNIVFQTTTLAFTGYSVETVASIEKSENTIFVTGVINEAPTELGEVDGTHAMALIVRNTSLDSYANAGFKLDNGELQGAGQGGLYVLILTDVQKNEQVLSVTWNGTDFTDYTINVDNAFLR